VIDALLRKWLTRLPHRSLLLSAPPDTDTSYRSCGQSAPSTQTLDEPGSGRICFEPTIRDSLSLDIGRQQVIRPSPAA
jgi:hypothetical protein